MKNPFSSGRRPAAHRRGSAPDQVRRGGERARWTAPDDGVTTGPPNPAWITIALDDGNLTGPQVDVDLGGKEPMVDRWELGDLVPTERQQHLLEQLTGHPREYFYQPTPPMVRIHGRPIYAPSKRGEQYRDIFQYVERLERMEEPPPDQAS